MAEEHRCQVSCFCANNYGFFGSPAAQNMCSKCYWDFLLKEQQSSNMKIVLNQSLILASPPSVIYQPSSFSALAVDLASTVVVNMPRTMEEVKESQQNQCLTCIWRVGLTRFKCRCRMMLCGTHHYPKQNVCEFDFKGIRREQIIDSNPVVKGEKLEKI